MTTKHHAHDVPPPEIPPPSDLAAPEPTDLHRLHKELSDLHDLLEQRAFKQADIRELLGRIRDTIPAPPPPPGDAPVNHAPVDVDTLITEPEHAHDQP